MEEIWKPIKDYETYSVSTFGRIRNDKTNKILKGNKDAGRLQVGFFKTKTKSRFFIHRLVALAFIENPENKEQIDHIDNNQSNNRVENLRWATHQENNRNTQIQNNNTTGVKGVYWAKREQKWLAKIMIDRIDIHIGLFNTIEEATHARQTRANEVFGIFTNACEKL